MRAGRERRRRRWAVAATAACALAPAAARATEGVSFLATPAGHVLLAVPEGAEGRPAPVVLALPDAPGPDNRSRPYLDLLNARGVATAEAPGGPAEDGAGAPPGAPAGAAGGVAGALSALAADRRLDASRIGVLAFGAAGAAALREAALAEAPTVLLYPGCDRLPPLPGTDRPALLLHGGMDRSDPPGACAAWAGERGGARRHEYVHATYGWDFSDGPWSDGLSLLPVPGAPGRRVWARSDPATTADAAARAADFLAEALAPRVGAAPTGGGGPVASGGDPPVRVTSPPSPSSGG